MKKIIASLFVSMFAFLAFPTASLATLEVNPTLEPTKKSENLMKADTVNTAKPETPVVQKSDYALPYPGILPDHPLYFLKKLRDAILDLLIADPTKKAEFYILQSDKHLNMTIFLVQKGNANLAKGTVQSSISFMEKAVKHLAQLNDAKKTIPGYIAERIGNSLTKHAQVYAELSVTAGDDLKDTLTKATQSIKEFQEQTKNL